VIRVKTRPAKKAKTRYFSKRRPRRSSVRENALGYGLNEEAVYNARLRGELLASPLRFNLIDAFAGAGGKTLGFSESLSYCHLGSYLLRRSGEIRCTTP
jgi:hypothetical protein